MTHYKTTEHSACYVCPSSTTVSFSHCKAASLIIDRGHFCLCLHITAPPGSASSDILNSNWIQITVEISILVLAFVQSNVGQFFFNSNWIQITVKNYYLKLDRCYGLTLDFSTLTTYLCRDLDFHDFLASKLDCFSCWVFLPNIELSKTRVKL